MDKATLKALLSGAFDKIDPYFSRRPVLAPIVHGAEALVLQAVDAGALDGLTAGVSLKGVARMAFAALDPLLAARPLLLIPVHLVEAMILQAIPDTLPAPAAPQTAELSIPEGQDWPAGK